MTGLGHPAFEEATARLEAWPRTSLATLPTVLRSAPRLARHLGVRHLYVKMDAETGFALGGNKVRKLEFELAPERIEGVTHLITAGGPQSNHCRVTAAAAGRLGLGCTLVLNGPEPEHPTGNALLHRLFGAEIVTVSDRTERATTMEAVAERILREGGHPLVIPIGASTPLGSLGYALAALELLPQLDALEDGCRETRLFVASSSCGTLAGLLLGLALAGRTDVRPVGVSADTPAAELSSVALELARAGGALLACDPVLLARSLEAVPLVTLDDQVGLGYGIPTEASRSATADFARMEGIVLDPTYSSKAGAGLIAHTHAEAVPDDVRVVFLHTGGAPGLLT
jgi:1-aminocyclopropane-1-carboxylate deaminase/D-cysteine desulfhydrase-like pyridoxal-dependent ACC family enzyme